MSDFWWRIVILGLVALAIAFSVWRTARGKRAKSTPVSRPDLGPGVHFFSSETCAPCRDARQVLQRAFGDRFHEVRFEEDPPGFGRFEVSSVPTVFVLGPSGEGVRLEGIPSPRQLRTQGS